MEEPFVRQNPVAAPGPKDPFGEGETVAAARRRRSIAIAVGLLVFVGLVFAVAILRLSANVASH